MAHDRHTIPSDQLADDPTGARRLLATFAATAPKGSRRDLLRWSAVVAGAAAGVRAGSALAAPAGGWSAYPFAMQEDVQTNVSLTIPFNPFGQPVTLDPHRAVNWGPFWNLFPNVWGGLLRFDENGAVQLDLAESYAVSEDGRTRPATRSWPVTS
jgi:hypothetical protein